MVNPPAHVFGSCVFMKHHLLISSFEGTHEYFHEAGETVVLLPSFLARAFSFSTNAGDIADQVSASKVDVHSN